MWDLGFLFAFQLQVSEIFLKNSLGILTILSPPFSILILLPGFAAWINLILMGKGKECGPANPDEKRLANPVKDIDQETQLPF